MAITRSIRHNTGATVPNKIIVANMNRQIRKVNLKLEMTLGTSAKKVVLEASLEVAPQFISILNMWERRACEMCIETPPRKITVSGC